MHAWPQAVSLGKAWLHCSLICLQHLETFRSDGHACHCMRERINFVLFRRPGLSSLRTTTGVSSSSALWSPSCGLQEPECVLKCGNPQNGWFLLGFPLSSIPTGTDQHCKSESDLPELRPFYCTLQAESKSPTCSLGQENQHMTS